MINQLGTFNFADLKRYLWRSVEDFGGFQAYLENYFKEISAGKWSAGIIYGGALSLGAGLQVNVSKGLALLSTGQLVAWDDQQVVLGAADAALPRKDRIELAYALVNNLAVTNIDNVVKTLDKKHVGTASVLAGVANAAPVVPALTAGRLSLGVVTTSAGQTVLALADIDQSDLYRSLSIPKDPQARTVLLANNLAAFTAISGLRFDPSTTRSLSIEGDLYRKTDTNELNCRVRITIGRKPVAGTWWIQAEYWGEDCFVEWSIDAATGQVQAKTSNLAGANYTGSLKIDSVRRTTV